LVAALQGRKKDPKPRQKPEKREKSLDMSIPRWEHPAGGTPEGAWDKSTETTAKKRKNSDKETEKKPEIQRRCRLKDLQTSQGRGMRPRPEGLGSVLIRQRNRKCV